MASLMSDAQAGLKKFSKEPERGIQGFPEQGTDGKLAAVSIMYYSPDNFEQSP